MLIKITLTILLLLLCFYPYAFATNAVMLDKIVAIVNKEAITWSELYKTMEFELAESHKDLSQQDKIKLMKENEKTFLEILIDMRLKLQEAQRLGLLVSNDEVEKAVSGIKAKYAMTDELFIEALRREGFTIEEYKQKLKERIIITRLIDQEVRGKIVIEEEMINQYLEKKKDLIKRSESFNISHIFVKKTNNRKADEEKAKDIYNKIKGGEDFSQVAKHYSEDLTATYGGELGVIKREDLSQDFARVLSKMKAGEVSEPFWSERGIHILKLNSVVVTDNIPQLKEQAKRELFEERFNRLYKNWLKGLRESAYIQLL